METLTAELSALRTWMIISAVIYAAGLLNFMFAQNFLLEILNRVSETIFGDRFPRIPLSTEKFWLALTNSMMLMLVVICVFVSIDPAKYIAMVAIVLFSKAFSTSQYLYMFARQKRYFAYLVGALTDGPIFLITLYFFVRAL